MSARFVYDGVSTMLSSDPYVADISLNETPPDPDPPTPGASAPGAVQSVTATAAVESVNLTWAAPASDGGAPITAYRIGRVGTTQVIDVAPTLRAYQWAPLPAGTAAQFTIRAVNNAPAPNNVGPATTTAAVTPTAGARTPYAPATATATAGVERVTVAWTPPTDNGGSPITGYVITLAGTSTAQVINDPAARSFVWQPLLAGVGVRFTVQARNSLGLGDPLTTNLATPAPQPGTPPPDQWFGWDPTNSTRTPPPLRAREVWPFWNNTGLWHPDLRQQTAPFTLGSMFSKVGSFTTSANNQIVEYLWIDGSVTVNHTGVIFRHCLITGRRSGTRQAQYWYCDIGCRDGAAGDFTMNSTDANHKPIDICCNLYGWTDNYKPGVSGGGTLTMQDCFSHDPRLAWDSWNSNYSHPDTFHLASGLGSGLVVARHNTIVCSGINNFTSTAGPGPAKEKCTRRSGPHWTDVDGNPLNMTTKDGDGGLSNGRTNAALIIFAGTVDIIDNYFTGAVYSYVNGPSRGSTKATGNIANQASCVAGRHPFGDPGGYSRGYSENRDYKTGALIR